MACRITELVLDCTDPEALARFWCAALDFEVLGREGAAVEIGRPGEHPTIVLDRAGGPKTRKLRLHFDVNATDRDQDAELERLEALGARRKDIGQGDVTWHVLEDPEGNEFCLLSRRVEP
ncbi:VOC family protein [Saccharothrix sp. Mg75]|uniref:VOC family protein n=1 Tax=Saccharothrix sp. Mg75 TaxID=3445357 RepID=UPI003EECFCC0